MRLGLIARMDKSGLGAQTLRLTRLLQPQSVMLIDSTSFNGSKQFPEWYTGRRNVMPIHGFPTDEQVRLFLNSVDTIVTCETFYNNQITFIARGFGVKTILIANPEFFDWYKPEFAFVPSPNKVIVPSKWKLTEMSRRFNADYLPTPIFEDEFKETRDDNLKRTGRNYLFINGRTAVHDRNGLESLYEALEIAKGDFTITVKSQDNVKKHPDPRLIYDFTNPDNQADLYKGFDALIQPRRYGGQTLSMSEALLSGLPVIMTDIDPNNKVLPPDWLVPATKTGEFMTRTMIDIYSASPYILAHKLDTLEVDESLKRQAYEIGKQYEAENLRSQYEGLLNEVPN
jgi:glycosyltransferase involved in cell wall biosynthesis